MIIVTDVTLPGAGPTGAGRVRGRRNYLPWARGPTRVAEPRALNRANRRFKKRMRWVKRQAYNDGRAALRAAGFPSKPLPPVLVCVFELQKRGALHAHLALGYTTEAERVFARAFIDSLKKWTPRCGLGFVQGWKQAEQSAAFGSDRAASYLCKYLTKDHPPWLLKTLKGPVVTVSRRGNRPVNVHDGAPPQDTATMGRTRRTLRLPNLGLGNIRQGRLPPRRPNSRRPGALSRSAATPTLPRGRGGDAGRLSEATGTNRCWPRSWVSRCAMPRSRADLKYLGICSTRAEACRGCRSVGSRDTRAARRWRASPLAPDALVVCRRRRRGVRRFAP